MRENKGEVFFGFDASGFDYHLDSAILKAAGKIVLDSFNLSPEDRKVGE
jgi:hypothetical protein